IRAFWSMPWGGGPTLFKVAGAMVLGGTSDPVDGEDGCCAAVGIVALYAASPVWRPISLPNRSSTSSSREIAGGAKDFADATPGSAACGPGRIAWSCCG